MFRNDTYRLPSRTRTTITITTTRHFGGRSSTANEVIVESHESVDRALAHARQAARDARTYARTGEPDDAEELGLHEAELADAMIDAYEHQTHLGARRLDASFRPSAAYPEEHEVLRATERNLDATLDALEQVREDMQLDVDDGDARAARRADPEGTRTLPGDIEVISAAATFQTRESVTLAHAYLQEAARLVDAYARNPGVAHAAIDPREAALSAAGIGIGHLRDAQRSLRRIPPVPVDSRGVLSTSVLDARIGTPLPMSRFRTYGQTGSRVGFHTRTERDVLASEVHRLRDEVRVIAGELEDADAERAGSTRPRRRFVHRPPAITHPEQVRLPEDAWWR